MKRFFTIFATVVLLGGLALSQSVAPPPLPTVTGTQAAGSVPIATSASAVAWSPITGAVSVSSTGVSTLTPNGALVGTSVAVDGGGNFNGALTGKAGMAIASNTYLDWTGGGLGVWSKSDGTNLTFGISGNLTLNTNLTLHGGALLLGNTEYNQLVVDGSAAGNRARVVASGSDTNVSLWLNTQGAGALSFPLVPTASLLACTASTWDASHVGEGAIVSDSTTHTLAHCTGAGGWKHVTEL